MHCNEQPSQATANPVGGKACSSTKGGLLRFSKRSYPVTLLPPPRRLVPSLGLGTTWVRQPRSGGCHHPTAATKCNESRDQATANPVGGKACSSTKGGLLRYIPNTYSTHKVSCLKFAYFQGKLPRYSTLNHLKICFSKRNDLAQMSHSISCTEPKLLPEL